MANSTITSKGQVTIPKEVRDSLGLEAGHRVSFLIREDGVLELHPEPVDLMSLCGVIKPQVRGVTIEGMDAAIREAVAKKK